MEQEAAKDAVDKLRGDKAVEAPEGAHRLRRQDQYSNSTSSAAKACASSSAVVLAYSTASGVNTSTRWTTSRTASACVAWASATSLVEYQREGLPDVQPMIEAIKEETVQLLFHVDIERVAMTEDEETESDEDEAVNAAEAVMGLDGEAAATGESLLQSRRPMTSRKTTIDETG